MAGARLGYNHIGVLLNRVVELFRERKRLHIAEVAAELGYRSPEYFRRSIWKLVEIRLEECLVKIDGWTYEWTCDDDQARKAVAPAPQ